MCRSPRNILKLYVKKSFFATLHAHIMTQKSIDLYDVVPVTYNKNMSRYEQTPFSVTYGVRWIIKLNINVYVRLRFPCLP